MQRGGQRIGVCEFLASSERLDYTTTMAQFPDTQWSLIRRSVESPSQRHTAFGQLTLAYRKAISAFFRARLPIADAEDATQSFLAESLEHAWWSRANADVSSFRRFLLMLLHRHLGHIRAAQRPAAGNDAIDAIADDGPTAEQQFDNRFALVLTQRAVESLRTYYQERERGALFEKLLPVLGNPPDHGELKCMAEDMGLPANTLSVELKRLRQRLRDQVRSELRELCADERAFENDWTVLQGVLGISP